MTILSPSADTSVVRAAVYVRISDDKRGDEAGVTRQTEDAQQLLAAHGWTMAAPPFVDNDLSAASGLTRPGYQALLGTVARRDVDVVVVWQTSRLWRNRRERAEGIELLRAAGVSVYAVRGPSLDMSTAYGRGMAGLLGEFDTMESEVKSERVVRALAQNADAGRPHGRRAYGWDRVYDPTTGRSRDVVNVAEAKVVREVAERILSGDSIRGIVGDLNARGVPSPTGKVWGKQMLRAVVTRERNAGLRVHRGEIVGTGAWDPILDAATWERVVGVLRDPSRRTSTGTAAAHLLSGIATCGVCGGVMRAATNRGVPSYKCADASHVTRKRADVDHLVEGVVVGRLARPDAVGLLAQGVTDADAAAELRDLEARLDVAADDYADGKLTSRQLERITARLRPQIDDARTRARAVDDRPVLAGLIGVDDVRAAWKALPLTRRRAVVDALLVVEVLRTRPGARTFDPETVRLTWKTVP